MSDALRFERVQPEHLTGIWPFIEEGLKRILEKQPEPWRPADVFAEVFVGDAALYLAIEPTQVVGFFILEVVFESFTRKPILQIWCAYAPGAEGNHADALQYEKQFNEFIDEIARARRVDRVRWGGRPGWARALKDRPISKKTIYERAIAPTSPKEQA